MLVITYVQRFTSVSGMRPVVAVDTVSAACLLLTPRSALAAVVELLIVCSGPVDILLLLSSADFAVNL